MINKLFTIGVYGKSKDEFFNSLVNNEIDTFFDIRRRRAVRGSKYSFVNSNKLQNELAQLNIKYYHILDLAPTNEIRNIQKEIDSSEKIEKRKREELSTEFIIAYKNQILQKYHPEDFLKLFNETSQNSVLFCVENNPNACHRSLVASYLKEHFQEIQIINL